MNNAFSASTDHFCADRPIEQRSQDLLGRRGFAEALALAIVGWKGNDSLVIGLHGPWGSGKSSVKNMVIEALGKDWLESNVRVIEFNPWQFANRDQLTEAFFREIGQKLGTSVFMSEEDRKRAIAQWRAYGAYVKAGVSLIEPFRRGSKWIYGAVLMMPLVQAVISYLNTGGESPLPLPRRCWRA